jgi:hypothetical protein
MPQRGSTHYLERIEETPVEYRIYVGGWFSGHALGDLEAKYPFPSIDVELARLKADYLERGGKETDFNAWGQGASWDSHTTDVREWLRS